MVFLEVLLEIQYQILTGLPVTDSIKKALASSEGISDEDYELFASVIEKRQCLYKCSSLKLWALKILKKGSQGHQIQKELGSLIDIIKTQVDSDVASHLASLPYRLSLPLFLFILPSFFLLIFSSLMYSLKGVF
jgi:flagellar motility protein MotE (MotC chaperone)